MFGDVRPERKKALPLITCAFRVRCDRLIGQYKLDSLTNSIRDTGIFWNFMYLFLCVNPEGRSRQVAERRADLDPGGEQGALRPCDNVGREVRVERDGVPARSRLLGPRSRGVRRARGATRGGEGDAHRHRPRRQTHQLWWVPTVNSPHSQIFFSHLLTFPTLHLGALQSLFFSKIQN